MRGYSIFLYSPVQARGASISFRELHKHLPLHRQAREARLWAEVKGEAHKQGTFLLSRLWAKVLLDFGASHSFIAASVVIELGLEVKAL